MKRCLLAAALLVLGFVPACVTRPLPVSGPRTDGEIRGVAFEKKTYRPLPVPRFEERRSLLPSPIAEARPLWVETYWKAWELAFRNYHEPEPHSGFVSRFIDAAFNENIFLWDSCFMTMFCNYGDPFVPGISTLDNFYAKQFPDGEICREINRATGVEYKPWLNAEGKPLFSRWGWGLSGADGKDRSVIYRGRRAPRPNPKLTLDALNHPILAWAELEHYRLSGDRLRLASVWRPLVLYYAALEKYLRQGNGLYMTDWASMDNSPRNPFLARGGTGVDISAEMVLFARDLAEIARLLGREEQARWRSKADSLSLLINRRMWDPKRKFYFDLSVDAVRSRVKTVAAFWTLIAGVASRDQARALTGELRNPATFGRLHPVPTCSADEAGYVARGGYWKGAVWAPTNTMVIRGLERYGYGELAREIALKHLDAVAEVYRQTGTIWENYAPDAIEPGRLESGELVKGDFVGWSGLGPILYLIEYGIGLKADAETNTVTWRIDLPGRSGCGNFHFNSRSASFEAVAAEDGSVRITVVSSGGFGLKVVHGGVSHSFAVKTGRNEFALEPVEGEGTRTAALRLP
jgi:hypothetical protein